MDKAKSIAKGGWHPPGKNGGKESWRGDNKGINQVVSLLRAACLSLYHRLTESHSAKAGWIGKGKDPHVAASEHQSRPLASLKDPDAFGPPPKHVNYHGGAAVPNAITPDRRGLGAPLSTEEIQAKEAEERREREQAEEAARKPAPPPVPYRANTTGIDTTNLPKPPVRRLDQEDGQQTTIPATKPKPKPTLPPRLPPRQNSRPDTHAPEPPPTYQAASQQPTGQNGDFNVGALNRLGKAGVSVPGFGIGSKPQSPTRGSQSPNPWASQSVGTSSPTTTQSPSLSGLGSRFSKLSTATPPPSSQSPSGGTTTQQKQDALRTASNFNKDPSSISLSDARATASTANNFRERHGEQVAAGGKWAGAMNKKYDVVNKVNGYTGENAGASQSQAQPPSSQQSSPWADEPSAGYGGPSPVRENPPILMRDNTQSPGVGGVSFKKAPPPPPAARKPGPPPVPLGSKPRS